MDRFLKKMAWGALLFCLLLSSCAKRERLLSRFSDLSVRYGAAGVLYSPDIGEGALGYTDGTFLERFLGTPAPEVDDFFLFCLSSLTETGECGVFVCHTYADAYHVSRLLSERLSLLSRTAKEYMPGLSDARIVQNGKTVLYAVMPDNDLAFSLLKKAI